MKKFLFLNKKTPTLAYKSQSSIFYNYASDILITEKEWSSVINYRVFRVISFHFTLFALNFLFLSNACVNRRTNIIQQYCSHLYGKEFIF